MLKNIVMSSMNPGRMQQSIVWLWSGYGTVFFVVKGRELGQVLHHSLEENDEESTKRKRWMLVMDLLVSIEAERKFRGARTSPGLDGDEGRAPRERSVG